MCKKSIPGKSNKRPGLPPLLTPQTDFGRRLPSGQAGGTNSRTGSLKLDPGTVNSDC